LPRCFFVSDLHGKLERYQKLFELIAKAKPQVVFIGGDILPLSMANLSTGSSSSDSFIEGYLAEKFLYLQLELKDEYPRVFIIMGNDDVRSEEIALMSGAAKGIWEYAHNNKFQLGRWQVYGYAYVPPTPFQLKDWERYDVSRYVDPGCFSPEYGKHTVPVPENELRYSTIKKDLEVLAGDDDLGQAIFLFHSPPYKTNLDRAALDGRTIDHAPLDLHVGSVAMRRFIKARQPLLTLHGHVHESARLTGSWQDKIGATYMFTAAHDGPELTVVQFDPADLDHATRVLI
jgi:Icc-related predicted phosphoesterase